MNVKRSTLQVTVLRNNQGAMTKKLSPAPDGSVIKTPACSLYDGVAERREIGGLQELAMLIPQLKHNEALCYGVAEREVARLVMKEHLLKHPDAIARDRDHFAFRKQPGFMMFDYDPLGEPRAPEEVIAIYRAALPEAADVSIMWRPSASSRIYNSQTGDEVRGICGIRIWIIVSDATKIPGLGKILAERLWAKGHAAFTISTSGQMLDRPLFDKSVYQPEHIDFVAGAICESPLQQRLPAPAIIIGNKDIFDVGTLPVLAAADIAAAANNRENARQRVTAQAQAVRAAWVAERRDDFAKRRHIDPSIAEGVLRNAVEHGVLGPDFLLLSVEHGEISVADVLADPEKYDGTRFADPLEPDYRDDPRVAYASLKSDVPDIYSHAHGGQRYVLSASDATPGDVIDEMNERFALITVGKSAFIVHHTTSKDTGKVSPELLAPPAFNLLMRNQARPDGKKKGHRGDYWLEHPRRKLYTGIEFMPGGGTPGHLNLFTGFAVDPKPGSAQRFWAFVREVICDRNDEAYRYARCWLAHMIQKPAELPGTALVLRGAQGTGKNTFADAIGTLIGQHYVSLHSMDQVTGRFNGHTKNALLVHANEAIWGGSRQQVGALKAMITDPVIAIEQKGIDIFQVGNFRRVIVSSNEPWAVPADYDDRRFVFLNVSAAHANDHAYFAQIRAELDAGGYAALMHDLVNEDLTGFIPAHRPQTGFGFDVKLRSADALIKWLHDALDCGGFQEAHTLGLGPRRWPEDIEKRALYESYREFHNRTENRKPESEAIFHPRLKKILPSFHDERPRPEKRTAQRVRLAPTAAADEKPEPPRPRVYVPGSLEAGRKDFERYMRSEGVIPWSPIDAAPELKVVQAVQPDRAVITAGARKRARPS